MIDLKVLKLKDFSTFSVSNIETRYRNRITKVVDQSQKPSIMDSMKYTLITSKGRIMQFYIRQVAELYQTINGGVIVDQLKEIVDNTVIV